MYGEEDYQLAKEKDLPQDIIFDSKVGETDALFVVDPAIEEQKLLPEKTKKPFLAVQIIRPVILPLGLSLK